MPQNLNAYVDATTVEGAKQTIGQGPVASQIAIKMLGTNGGGFFNANAAHPYENPTALSNLVQMLLIFLARRRPHQRLRPHGRRPAPGLGGLRRHGPDGADRRHRRLLGRGRAAIRPSRRSASTVRRAPLQAGGNMEGKEVRFGIANSALFATVTTDASCGAVNSMHDSFMPLGGMVPLVNILLGEVIIGGVGAGMYGMLLMAIIAVFVAGLMVGRTPEYVGKKIEAREVKMTMLAILVLSLSILGFTAIATVVPAGLAGPLNPGPHGFSEILYAYTSGTGNNGSAFAGISANTLFYNTTIGLAMLIGRFAMIVPMVAVAGSLAAKKQVPPSAGTFPTHTGLFVGLLIGVVLIVGGLTYFPAVALGPIVEHAAMQAGTLF